MATHHVVDFGQRVDISILAGKSVLITGGASGMGAAVATAFAQHKARVTFADLNKDLGEQFASQLRAKGLDVNFVLTDVTSWDSQVTAFKSAIKHSGVNSIDIVVAAAGLAGIPFILPDEEPASLDRDPPKPARVDAIYDVNAKGVHYTSKLAQHYFGLKRDTGHQYRKTLILFSSLGGYLQFNHAEYCSSKWAVRGLFRSVRSMMEDAGYRTNLIAPWIMETPMTSSFVSTCRDQGIAVGTVSDVVDVVIRCASDESVCGRALAIGAAKSFDLEDDLKGLDAGKAMSEYHKEQECQGLMKLEGQRP